MGNEITAIMIAEYFLTKESMTQKKLQKLVYYAYVWYIVSFNNNVNRIKNLLFIEKPEAWVHGPVFRTLYDAYRTYGWNNIPKVDNFNFKDKGLEKFLDSIWDIFGKYDGDELEVMTHKETPWIKARNGISAIAPSTEKINKEDIYLYYSNI